jgi:hypothetical protein
VLTISTPSSPGSGRGNVTWAITENIGRERDDLVNVFEISDEAKRVTKVLNERLHGTRRQFTCRFQFKPIPKARHWQAHDATGEWIKNYETWEMAQEDLMKRRDLYIKMVEEPFPGKSRV